MGRRLSSRAARAHPAVCARPGGVWRPRATCLATVAQLALAWGCVTAPPATRRRPRLDRTVITEQAIREGHYTSAYEAVEALRSNWLHPRGPDTVNQSSPVWVYVNANRAGDVTALRSVLPQSVVYIRFYDGLAASARWGPGHGRGVIFVSTLPPGASKIMP
jgi:hypothetical protein